MQTSRTRETRALTKSGGSMILTIPMAHVRVLNWRAGDLLQIELKENHLVISLFAPRLNPPPTDPIVPTSLADS